LSSFRRSLNTDDTHYENNPSQPPSPPCLPALRKISTRPAPRHTPSGDTLMAPRNCLCGVCVQLRPVKRLPQVDRKELYFSCFIIPFPSYLLWSRSSFPSFSRTPAANFTRNLVLSQVKIQFQPLTLRRPVALKVSTRGPADRHQSVTPLPPFPIPHHETPNLCAPTVPSQLGNASLSPIFYQKDPLIPCTRSAHPVSAPCRLAVAALPVSKIDIVRP